MKVLGSNHMDLIRNSKLCGVKVLIRLETFRNNIELSRSSGKRRSLSSRVSIFTAKSLALSDEDVIASMIL